MAQRDKKGRFVRTKPDYKAMYEAEEEKSNSLECDVVNLVEDRNRWKLKCKEAEEQHDFLLSHAPFWLRWKYNRKFKKGGSK